MAVSFISGYQLSSKTRIRRNSPLVRSRTDAGTHRFIDLGRSAIYTVSAVFEALTETEALTLVAWLDAVEGGDFTIDVGDSTYQGTLNTDRPVDVSPRDSSPNLWDVRFEFEGNNAAGPPWILLTGLWDDSGEWDDAGGWFDG